MKRARGTIHVYTFKEGALSAVAHDLRFHVGSFAITLDAENVVAELDLRTLTLDGPVRGNIVHETDFDPGTRSQVELSATRDVLDADRRPTARFAGRALPRGEGFTVAGELALAGRAGQLSFEVRRENDAYVSAFEIRPSLWGIAPYKALLGAIRLKDRVRIELTLTEV